MQGREFFLTDEVKAFIVEAASRGMLQKDIAVGCGVTPSYFSKELKHKFPEIEELIQQGVQLGREKLLTMSWAIIEDKKDPARNQELHRLNRKLRTEEAEGQAADGTTQSLGGFTVTVIPKKDDANTEQS